MANFATVMNTSGEILYHLRRIGPPASVDGVVNVMDLYKCTYLIGRKAADVDFYLDSVNHTQSACLSRCHARIVRQTGNQHRLFDDSLNGVFVNNLKILGSCILHEGDKVIFGHPSGARLKAGSRSRQPNSDHQFIFEVCSCTVQQNQRSQNHSQKNDVTADCLSSNSCINVSKGSLCTPDGFKVPSSPCTLESTSSQQQTSDKCIVTVNAAAIANKDNKDNPIENQADLDEFTNNSNSSTDDEKAIAVAKQSELSEEKVEDIDDVEPSESSDQNISELEGTVNLILSDLCAMRGDVENSCTAIKTSDSAVQLKSPTKDISIQTNQRDLQDVMSPTKEMGIQTSQFIGDHFVSQKKAENYEILSPSTYHVAAESMEVDDNICLLNKSDLFSNSDTNKIEDIEQCPGSDPCDLISTDKDNYLEEESDEGDVFKERTVDDEPNMCCDDNANENTDSGEIALKGCDYNNPINHTSESVDSIQQEELVDMDDSTRSDEEVECEMLQNNESNVDDESVVEKMYKPSHNNEDLQQLESSDSIVYDGGEEIESGEILASNSQEYDIPEDSNSDDESVEMGDEDISCANVEVDGADGVSEINEDKDSCSIEFDHHEDNELKNDEGAKKEENSRKRKMTSDISSIDTDEGCSRKRHASENVLENNTDLLNLRDRELSESNWDGLNEVSSTKQGLNKLKEGMKHFFQFKSENTTELSQPKNIEYFYIQDQSSKMNLLHLDIPEGSKNVEKLGRLENRGSEMSDLDNCVVTENNLDDEDVISKISDKSDESAVVQLNPDKDSESRDEYDIVECSSDEKDGNDHVCSNVPDDLPVLKIFDASNVSSDSSDSVKNGTSWLTDFQFQPSKPNLTDTADLSAGEVSDCYSDLPSPDTSYNYFSYDDDDDAKEFHSVPNESSGDSSDNDEQDKDKLRDVESDVVSAKRMETASPTMRSSCDVMIDEDCDKNKGSDIDELSNCEHQKNDMTKTKSPDLKSTVNEDSDQNEGSDTDELSNCEQQKNDVTKTKSPDLKTTDDIGGNCVDFDFCDSDSNSGECLVDTKDCELKRKCNSDGTNLLSKKTRTDVEIEGTEELKTEGSELTPFKTPPDVFSTPGPSQSEDFLSCTQFMETSQSPALNVLTLRQISNMKKQLEVKVNDKSRLNKISREKAKGLIEKLRERKRIKEEATSDSSSSPSATSGGLEAESDSNSSKIRTSGAQAASDDIDTNVSSCQLVIGQLRAMFEQCVNLRENPRVQAWRKELIEVEKRLKFSKTVIAVVGDTGAGKSSLMNALLDHRSVLPTSGIRACTAVVVEVIENTVSNEFLADIEFLQREEWFDELKILLNDLKGLDGKVKNRSPNPASDAYVSYCKVKAVYGKIDEFCHLARLTMVTHWLGRVKVIRSKNAEVFRKQVEKYIETQEPTGGGQYWPIVKHVTLKIPNCDVCSTGASLVDLPGVRDSNAARDKIAKEYLKNCTAVWVVSSIHRAIDDKTAKDLMGENFRRQLLMDGQYGSIAFICTKTDVIIPSEIIRSLKLEGKTKDLEEEIRDMESEKYELDLMILTHTKEIQSLTESVEKVRKDEAELEETLNELRTLLDGGDLDSSESEEKEAVKEYEDELKQKKDEVELIETRINSLTEEKQFSSQKALELDGRLNAKRKSMTSMCAKARNEYSKSQIKQDFRAGLKEMKRRAGMIDDNEEDIYSDDDDEADGDIGSSAENLKVFCCSSTEYQKMKNLLTDDGPPQVFSSLSDTQIPELRCYVHKMTDIRRKQSLERLIRNLGTYVFDVQTYLLESGDMKFKNRQFVKSVIDAEIEKFNQSLAPVIELLVSDIDIIFDGSIKPKIQQGASNAASAANDTCAKWGSAVNRDKTADKRSGGIHFQTYRATCRRLGGVYKSPTYGIVDFNEDLSEPMYRTLTIVWDRTFGGLMWKVLDKLLTNIMRQIKVFCLQLGSHLEKLSIQKDRINRVSAQLEVSASNKLKEMVSQLKDTVTNRQRDISRLITPHVQSSLTPVYNTCATESGAGMYMRIKTYMSQGIDSKRRSMFDEATLKLMEALMNLQNEMIAYVQEVCRVLMEDLRTAFEPLWDTAENSEVLKAAFMNQILSACSSVRTIYEKAGLSNTEERSTLENCSSTCASADIKVQGDDLIKLNVVQATSRIDRPVHTLPRGYGSVIKQERNEIEQRSSCITNRTNVTQFGIQTLQDLQAGRLDISPVEVTVESSNPCSSVSAATGTSVQSYPVVYIKPESVNTHQPFTLQRSLISGQRFTVPAAKSTIEKVTVAIKKEPNTIFVINKENHGMSVSSSPANSLFNCNSQGKKKKCISLSQRNNSSIVNTPTVSNVRIKTEPADNGSYGRKRPKYLGTIDLTDD